ncbi:MAG: peptidylprolyl isomerase [Verrucomicrobia bacterium]|nr:peptidylprolyl isomerase [Verrucomicrobiota bacterium]
MGLFRLLLAAAAGVASGSAAPESATLPDGLYAEITTPRGMMLAELYFQRAPLTVTNFVGLAEGTLGPRPGRPFFAGLTFHRVVPHFVVQGGDPLGTGEGGPGYLFPDEFVPGLRHDAAGVLSMANDGPDTNGSQFFITLQPVNRLNYLHSVFGRVVRGLDVLQRIQAGDRMTAVRILRRGPAAEAFQADTAVFAARSGHARKYAGAAAPGPRAEFDDPDHLLPADPPRAQAFQRKLANFERATGRKLRARLYAHYPPEKPGQSPGQVVGTLARRLDLPADGTLAVYFADRAQWVLWIGDGHLAAFTGRAGSAAELARDGTLHRAKREFLRAALADGERTAAEFARDSAPNQILTPAERLKFDVDAVLDGLILRLESNP